MIDATVVIETGKTRLCIDEYLWQLVRGITIDARVVIETGKTGLCIDE